MGREGINEIIVWISVAATPSSHFILLCHRRRCSHPPSFSSSPPWRPIPPKSLPHRMVAFACSPACSCGPLPRSLRRKTLRRVPPFGRWRHLGVACQDPPGPSPGSRRMACSRVAWLNLMIMRWVCKNKNAKIEKLTLHLDTRDGGKFAQTFQHFFPGMLGLSS